PLPLSGAAWWDGVAWVRLSGASSAVRAALERLGGERVDTTAASQWWNALRHCQHPIFQSGTLQANTSQSAATATQGSALWRLSLPDTTPPLTLSGDPLIDWGGALRWYAHDPQSGDALRKAASAAGGTAMCWNGPAPASGRLHPLQSTVATLTRRLNDRFDPHGIFNPGRMIAGL